MTKGAPANQDKPDTYQQVIDVIHSHVNRPYTAAEAHEAARNLIGFCTIALAVKTRMRQDLKNDQHRRIPKG